MKKLYDVAEVKKDIKKILSTTIEKMKPEKLIQRYLKRIGNKLVIQNQEIDLSRVKNIYVVGFGKASGNMAIGVEDALDIDINESIIIVPRDMRNRLKLRAIEVYEADHPIPTQSNLDGTEKIIDIVKKAKSNDIILILISGGGSALFTLPKKGLSLTDLAITTKVLMRSGADINELNTVRKHLSQVKGGQLVKYCGCAKVFSFILSDVVGDPIDIIASGPTAPDPTTYHDALTIIKKYDLIDKLPSNVINHLKEGVKGIHPETPKPGDPIFNKVKNIIIGNNRMALKVAVNIARKTGYKARILTSYVEGEARHVGNFLAGLALEINKFKSPFKPPILLFAGGETTVEVKGRGIGGRNQELVLSAGIKIRGYNNIIIASIGTDGIDGNSPAAGGIIDGGLIEKAFESDLNPIMYLKDNDSYTFLKKLKGVIITGYTDTNVNDIIVLGIL